MPISPKTPQQWTCCKCGWQHELLIKSDVLVKPVSHCSKCGGEMELKPASLWKQIKDGILKSR